MFRNIFQKTYLQDIKINTYKDRASDALFIDLSLLVSK